MKKWCREGADGSEKSGRLLCYRWSVLLTQAWDFKKQVE